VTRQDEANVAEIQRMAREAADWPAPALRIEFADGSQMDSWLRRGHEMRLVPSGAAGSMAARFWDGRCYDGSDIRTATNYCRSDAPS
jgi:hypothetical protein